MQGRIFYNSEAQEFPTSERCHIRELLSRADGGHLSIAQARVEAGTSTANHALDNTEEYYYILSGRGDMYLDNVLAGEVGPGDIVHIPAGMPQYICNKTDADLLFICICNPAFTSECYIDMEG